jgi:hypothetical protein
VFAVTLVVPEANRTFLPSGGNSQTSEVEIHGSD